jgi:cellobiose transport system permease protein
MTTLEAKPPVAKLPRRRRPRWQKVGLGGYIALTIMALLSMFPFYWMFIVASNGTEEVSKIPPTMIPGPRFFTVIENVYKVVDFNIALMNTVIVGFTVAVAQVLFSALSGFAFAKLNFKARRGLILFVIGTMMLPSQLGIIPLYMLVSGFGWIDTLNALIVPALVTAFGVFWMRQVIDAQVPNEMLEAASIDGAGVLRIYWSIVLPIISQSGFVLGLFSFLATWNDFLWPNLVLQSPGSFTVQVAVQQLKASYFIDYALNLGGAFMATAPLLLLFVFVGRRLVSGVMDGAVKG